jgi:hypothetical protein
MKEGEQQQIIAIINIYDAHILYYCIRSKRSFLTLNYKERVFAFTFNMERKKNGNPRKQKQKNNRNYEL